MRKFNFSWLFFIFLLLAEGCASPPPDEPGRIAAISERTKNLNDIRRKAIQETASGIGAQLALAWQSKQIDRMLKAQTRRLDQVFDFNALVLNHNVLPPVLLEGRNTLNVDNAETLRLSDRDYQILFPARFVSAPPSWRDYLWMNYKKPDVPDASLLPKGKVEIDSWNKYLTLGWLNGLEQASNIFYANLGRLNRDFGGMLLYRKLYAQKLVSAPFVSQASLGVTGGGNNLRINDRILRITAISQFDPNSKHWQPVLAKEKPKNNGDKFQPGNWKLRKIIEQIN